jgi:hypothetical protein
MMLCCMATGTGIVCGCGAHAAAQMTNRASRFFLMVMRGKVILLRCFRCGSAAKLMEALSLPGINNRLRK